MTIKLKNFFNTRTGEVNWIVQQEIERLHFFKLRSSKIWSTLQLFETKIEALAYIADYLDFREEIYEWE